MDPLRCLKLGVTFPKDPCTTAVVSSVSPSKINEQPLGLLFSKFVKSKVNNISWIMISSNTVTDRKDHCLFFKIIEKPNGVGTRAYHCMHGLCRSMTTVVFVVQLFNQSSSTINIKVDNKKHLTINQKIKNIAIYSLLLW